MGVKMSHELHTIVALAAVALFFWIWANRGNYA